MSNKSVIGVDLDGINIRTGKVKNGKIISDFSLKLSSKESSEEILQKLIKSIKKIYSDDVTGIGIGIPGLVDVKEGIVYNVENIPSWKNIHLKEKLEIHFQVPIYVNNDKNCFAAGEKYFGSGRNYRNIVGLIIGKRMGAGTLIDNRLNPGMSFSAGEFGKIPYKKRTFEYYCSEQFFSDEHKIDVDDLIRKSEKGDQQALKIFNQFGNHLGDAILTLLYAGNPEIIILGGSLTKIFSLVKDSMWEKVKSFPYKHMIENIKIEISKQQEIAILGAAALYYDAKKTRILEIAEQKSKNAEEALQKERNLLNVILDSIPDNIYIKDSKSHITKVNKAMATTFGTENSDQVVGKTDFDFFKKEHAQQVYDAEQKLMRTGEPLINFEEKETWPDGSETWVSTSKIPLKDKNGKITGIIGISKDITNRKNIENEVQRRATQASVLYETAQRLSSELDIGSLLSEIVHAVCEAFNYYGVMLLLPDKDAKALTLRSIAGGYENVFPDDLTLKFGEGLIGMAASTRKIQMSGDVSKDPDYVKKAEEVTQSELAVPLKSGRKVIGVLDIQSDKLNAFDKTDVAAMETLSSQIASAIENARLYDQAQQEIAERKRIEKEIQHRATQATLLYKTGQKLSSKLDLDSLLNEIVITVCETYNYNGVMLLLPDENAKALTLRSIAGDYKNVFPDDLTLKFGEGMIGKAASTKKIQVCGDVTKDSSYVKKVGEVTLSELSVPIKSGKKVIGVLDIQSDKIDAFDSTDVEAMEILSSQIASTIENARLYDQAQQEIADRKRAELEVRKSHDNLEKAKKETDNILHNVEEGLLLINPSFNVGSQYSSALESILCETNLASKNFISILKNKVGDETVSSVKEYLDLMFTSNIDENMLIDLNPLINIELVFNRGSEKSTLSKILIFKFQRIIVNKKIVELIVTVNDITERVKLEKDLEKTREENKRRMDWLLCILNVEPVMLREFVQSARDEIENVQKTLHRVEQNEQILESLDNVYRSVHTMKGNASLLEIDFFAEKAHQVEDKIVKLRNKKQITLQDMNELFDQVKMVQTVYEEIKRLLDQIGQIHDQFRPKRSHEHNLLVKSLSKLVSNLAREHKKQIELVTNNFKGDIIPYKHRLLIRDVLVQLIRNSIFHGIEEEAERKDRGKKTIGILEIENFKKNGNFILKFKDDGRGLLLDKLREKAKEQGKWSPDEIKKWDDQKLTEIIFIPGVTTSEQATMTAGRGMGMDIIKNKVAKIGGKINITTKEGLFTEFDIILPIHD